ncbi:hypothetical protein C8R43DRAFT_945363 [Mycena crocata]|nr:hypothetical protein C8R43DRAFT_945363 [Mycena crocata]
MLDKLYDVENARVALDSALEKSMEYLAEQEDRSCQHLNAIKHQDLLVQVTGQKRKIWRLGPANEEGVVEDELVFRFQGILTKVMLTPGDTTRMEPRRLGNLTQQITLGGVGSTHFEAGTEGLHNLQSVFESFFHKTAESTWTSPQSEAFEVSASNKFFTSKADDPAAEHVPFGYGVDPLDVLQELVGDKLVHSVDNAVRYYVKATDPVNHTDVYDAAFPGNFKVGDLVEMQASLIAFQGRDSMKIHCHLRALTLLDAKFSKQAQEARAAEASQNRSAVILRRKIGYSPANKARKVSKTTSEKDGVAATFGSS